MEHFFSPSSGEDQKKSLHQNWSTFFLEFRVETCAQMHTKVKVSGEMQMQTQARSQKFAKGGAVLEVWGRSPQRLKFFAFFLEK